MSSVDFREFQKAIEAFAAALAAPKNDLSRDASIQRFEFCIELSWKLAKKTMGSTSGSAKTVIREMAQDKLVDDTEKWLEFVDLRNLTAHTYREALAEEVYEKCKIFLPMVQELLKRLKERSS
jgi:nucleotidyltransferase substrate binding protein (TIGR01987 family)